MTQRLTDMSIDRVSLVDKGANARVFAVLKREAAMTDPVAVAVATVEEETPPAGFAAWLRKMADAVLGAKPEAVAKTATFAEIVAGQELSSALYDSWWTLEEALWSAIYAVDDTGADLSLEAKQMLVAQNLDEFKAYLLAAMERGIEKRHAGQAELASRHVAAVVAKVGRKISGSRMERLTSAADALNSVLVEVAEAEAGEQAETAEEEPVETSELVSAISEAVTKANEPLVARIEAIEKRTAGTPGDEEPVTLEGIAEAVGKIAERLETVEKSRGQRTSLVDETAAAPVKKRGVFAGVLD